MTTTSDDTHHTLIPGRAYEGMYLTKGARLVPLLRLKYGLIETAIFPYKPKSNTAVIIGVSNLRSPRDIKARRFPDDFYNFGISIFDWDDHQPLKRREARFVEKHLREKARNVIKLETYMEILNIIETVGLDKDMLLSESPS